MDDKKDGIPVNEPTAQGVPTTPAAQEPEQEEPATAATAGVPPGAPPPPPAPSANVPPPPLPVSPAVSTGHTPQGGQPGPGERPLSDVKVGDIDELTGQPIIYIVYSTPKFIVSIDKELSLNWLTANSYDVYASDFGEVAGSCDLSDALVDRIFNDPKNRLAYKKMLGNVIARLLDEKNSASARKLLAIVDERINEHARERVRMSYIYAALATVGIVGVLLAITVYNQVYFLNKHHLDELRYKVVLCILLGGVGAFITTFARFKHYTGSLVAGVNIHRLDGFLRIFYGLIAGLIIVLAIKADALIGFADQKGENIPYLFYFLAMVAGASEVLIPNLIKQSEDELGIKKLEKKEQETGNIPVPNPTPNPNPSPPIPNPNPEPEQGQERVN